MNKEDNVFLDTEEGKLLLCHSDYDAGVVNVYRMDTVDQREYLGYLLSANPNTATQYGKLSDSEFEVLDRYLKESKALRDAEHEAEMLVYDAETLANSSIMDPADAEELQQAAGHLRAILEGQGFRSSILAPKPSVLVRHKVPADPGFTWESFLVDGIVETYHVGVAVSDQGSTDIEADNPFKQTLEGAEFLAYIDAAQKEDLF